MSGEYFLNITRRNAYDITIKLSKIILVELSILKYGEVESYKFDRVSHQAYVNIQRSL